MSSLARLWKSPEIMTCRKKNLRSENCDIMGSAIYDHPSLDSTFIIDRPSIENKNGTVKVRLFFIDSSVCPLG